MSRILIIANNAGGLYIFRKDLIQALIKQHHQVMAITPFTSKISELKALGLDLIESEIDRRGTNPLHDFKLFRNYRKVIKETKPDLVITYTIKPNIYGGFVARMMHIPYATNITGLGTAFENAGIIRALTIRMYKVALKKAKVVFFENSSNANYFVQSGIVKKQQMKVLNGAGVDTEYFHYLPYPGNEETFNFLFVGRVMKEKGIEELFASMERLTTEGYNCKLTIVGTLEENYKEQINRYQQRELLYFAGYTDDVREYIKDAHCSVLPSYHEGMSNTNLECASCGRPIITSNIPGCREAITENISGFLCEPQNINSLYDSMKRMLQLTNEQRINMGKAARDRMIRIFDKRAVVEETINTLAI